MAIVRSTAKGQARQVHPNEGKTCNCHGLIRWVGQGFVVGEGIEIDGYIAKPLDWIVKITDQIRIVKAKDFLSWYEIIDDEDSPNESES